MRITRLTSGERALLSVVKRLSHGVVTEVRSGSMYGPFAVPGKPLFAGTTKLFIGKVTRNLRGKMPLEK